ILDCGCGTGWLSYFLAQRGYEVVGTDISADAIALARRNPLFRGGRTPEFLVADSEALTFVSAFDAVVFFDSLHHATDELALIAGAYRALRPGGICPALEPGRGHERKSAAIDAEFDVTDKDMPPAHVCRLGRSVGFRRCRTAPAPQQLGKALYAFQRVPGWRGRLLGLAPIRHLTVAAVLLWQRRSCGIAILHKD